jgi:hypothetical protein
MGCTNAHGQLIGEHHFLLPPQVKTLYMCRRPTDCTSDQLGYAQTHQCRKSQRKGRATGIKTNSRPWMNMRLQACASPSIAGSHPCRRRPLVSGVTATYQCARFFSYTCYRESMLRVVHTGAGAAYLDSFIPNRESKVLF